MATEVLTHDENAPAVLFKDIPGTLPGSRVLVNFFGGLRQKMTLGFPTHLSKLELSDAFRVHYMAELKPIPPKFVNDGPIFENVMQGDGYRRRRYSRRRSGTRTTAAATSAPARFNVTRDPDDGWINLRHLPRDDPRQANRRLLHLARQARPHPARQVLRAAASRCRSRSSSAATRCRS